MSLKIAILFLLFITIQSHPNEFSISAIHQLIESKNWTCTDVIFYFTSRSMAYNPLLNSIINMNPNAFTEAKKLDDFYRDNKRLIGDLHCIPVTVKDNIDVAGTPTTGGIKALRNSYPNRDADIIKRLKGEGAIILSKANLGEMAQGNENSELGGLCRNPFDLKRSCGGSSTGSGANVNAALAILGIGTDTDGSILMPGTFNGIYTLRTPQGNPNTDGSIPVLIQQDTIGPMTKYLDDLVLSYSVMTNNSAIFKSYQEPFIPNKLKLGIIKQLSNSFSLPEYNFNYILDNEVKAALDETLERLESLGINVIEYDFTNKELAQLLISSASVFLSIEETCLPGCLKRDFNSYFGAQGRFESDSPYRNYDDLYASPLLTNHWQNRLNISNVDNPDQTCIDNCVAYYKNRAVFENIFSQIFQRDNIDALMVPTRLQLPYIIGQNFTNSLSTLTSLAAFSGYSALNMPVDFTEETLELPDGLPIGMLLISPEQSLVNSFRIAKIYEISYGRVKLPKTTPLLNDFRRNECPTQPNSSSLIINNYLWINLVINILVFTFFS